MIPSWVRCPRCRAVLTPEGDTWRCTGCEDRFPVIHGVPDLRLHPDPWIPIEEDRRKGCQVAAEAAPGFEAAVRHYWQLTPDTPLPLAERHIGHVLHAEARTREWLAHLTPLASPGEQWLDVGCGTADLAAAAPAGTEVTGVDVAFRWLCVARRRLEDAGRSQPLLCANAESLPVASESFDRVFFLGTIEHIRDLSALVSEARRVLRPGGWIYLRSVNRYSLLPEPHVGLWGLGFLPRGAADRYARWRGRGGYRHHWPRSAWQVARALRAAGFEAVDVTAARLLSTELVRLPRALRWSRILYQRLQRWPGMQLVAPLFEGKGRK